jgi:hypothetical protein
VIETNAPQTWEALENTSAKILREAGFFVEQRKEVKLVRGTANVDIVFTDAGAAPPITTFIECKHWNTEVTKKEVQAFRTIVQDAGAHSGMLLGSRGFQSGAFAAATSSNVRLIDWKEFEEIYEDRWTDNYLRPALRPAFEPLVDLTEPLSSKLCRELGDLSVKECRSAIETAEKLTGFAFFGLRLYVEWRENYPGFGAGKLQLPLRKWLPALAQSELPSSIVEITAARQFLSEMIREANAGVDQIEREIQKAFQARGSKNQNRTER